MRDFQEFIDKKIAVEATDEFLQLCEKKVLCGQVALSRPSGSIKATITLKTVSAQ